MANFLRVAVVLFTTLALSAQTATTTRRPYIRVTGQGEIGVKPDQAQLAVGVTTMASTAQDAAAQNADRVTAVIAALRAVLGANAKIETISYSLNPNYTYPRDGGQPTLTGYTANNTVEATIIDLSLIGRAIDESIKAGANRVNSLRFSLQNDAPQREQALRAAVVQARAKAQAIAGGANVRLGTVLAIEEASSGYIVPNSRIDAVAAAQTTPIESGQVEVRASVTAEFEILQ